MRRLVAALAFGSIVLAAPALAQSGRAVSVEIDGTTRVQLRGAASSVVVGNPAIADVTVTDANTLFIVGKGYGATEIVAVDEIGRVLFQSPVVVSAPQSGQVRVWRGARVTEMACGASCSPSIRSVDTGAAEVTP